MDPNDLHAGDWFGRRIIADAKYSWMMILADMQFL